MIFGTRGSVFINGLSVRSSLFPQKMSASAVELGFFDDFLGQRVLVFINGFSASSSLCTLKISASAVELGFEDDFWDTGAQFSSRVCL
jgi:ethanolamine utilization microcompartment shell protein EutS